MFYKCISCGKEVEINLKTAKKIQCTFCGKRILIKPRSKIVRTVSAV